MTQVHFEPSKDQIITIESHRHRRSMGSTQTQSRNYKTGVFFSS